MIRSLFSELVEWWSVSSDAFVALHWHDHILNCCTPKVSPWF
jgi:hypothetical protein